MALNWKIFTQRPYIQSLSLEEQIRLFNIANEKSIRLRESKFQDFANSNSTSQGAAGDGDTGVTPLINTYSINFDNIGDYIELAGGADPITHFTPSSKKLSISMWIRMPDATPGSATYPFSIMSAGGATKLGFKLKTNGKMQLVLFAGSAPQTTITGDTILSDNTWHHIAATWDASNIRLYVDGTPDATSVAETDGYTATSGNTWVTLGAYRYGATGASKGGYFLGDIDEFAFWNNLTLTDDQILSAYNNGVPNDISSLSPTSWFRFEEGSGTTVINLGSSAINGTNSGAVYSTDVPT
jgi:hypothetical protein